MRKPTVYLDTSLISSYWYDGRDGTMIYRRQRTRDWWDAERLYFRCLTSHFTEDELRRGVFPRQRECLRMCRRLPYCPVTAAATNLWFELSDAKLVPDNKPIDGWQLALTIQQRLDYLVSWNYSHLANPQVQERLATFCRKRGLSVPWLVSPDTIPKVCFGQEIRRTD
ncbi:MAG TPA: hypothetical protein VK137_21395 [Planctomycetaceae bacterium]|nr:hypothetical protein [Planctomycetaceae bacterium]